MRTPDEVTVMLRLKDLGWGVRRSAAELGCRHMTVRRYLAAGSWAPPRSPARPKALDGLDSWLAERVRRHRGHADVIRQDRQRELGITISLRTVERAVAPLRQELEAEARATVRFETPPGRQLQVDFGALRVPIEGEERGRVYLFVATLGSSRRISVRPFRHERQSAWLDGIEGAFRHFGGICQEVLLDNATALVTHHDRETRALLGLVSLLTLWADDRVAQDALRPRQASWYAKPDLTFSDAIAAVRYRLWLPEDVATSPELNDVLEIPRPLFERLTDTLCYAG